jgi:magnesium-transporting ATPase (P-type)
MSTHADAPARDNAKVPSFLDEGSAHRLLRWMTLGGLVLGTFGTFHAVTSLVFEGPARYEFSSARLEAVHHMALVTIVCSQILQLLGSVALWRRRLIGRTLLLTYAVIYLTALLLVESMRALDTTSMMITAGAAQRAIVAMSQMHLVVYGSLFPLFLATFLTRPWIVRLLRRRGEPLPEEGTPQSPGTDGRPEQRLAA